MSNLNTKAERALFEAAMGLGYSMERTWDGTSYAVANTAGAWAGWCAARRAVPAQASAPEVDDLAALVARLVRALRTAAPGHDLPEKALDYLKRKGLTGSALRAAPVPAQGEPRKFKLGDQVRKTKGSQWKGEVVGQYSTELNPEGYCVESSTERGSVQIYPAAALELNTIISNTVAPIPPRNTNKESS